MVREPASSSSAASALFDYAKKLERKSREGLEAAGKLEGKLAKIRPGVPSLTKPLPKRRQEWFEKFRWFVTSGGKLAIGGRDAQSNALLIKRHLEDNDVVYHADLFGSPFFVVKDGRRQTEQEVLELAQATVSFSSGWKTGLGAADAYWVLKDQVSSSAESGEYLAKGSFVIRGRKNFVRHALLQVAVGRDSEGRVVAGPESAISKACSRYVVLVPHREKPTDTAKKILRELSPSGEPASGLDDVLRALPAGGGKIVNLGSSHGLIATGNAISYKASKGGVHSLTRELAYEWIRHGINVNAVAPGPVDTPRVREMDVAAGRVGEALRADMERRVPLGRRLTPEEVAGPIVFLVSPAAAAIVGHVLVIDGGQTIF